jgi:flagellar hook assembly protein FlgD
MSTISSTYDRNYKDMLGNDDYRAQALDKSKATFQTEKEESISFKQFFDLMIMQLKNQDFMNPQDDSQYLAQLAQIATMKAMEEIAYYGKSNYATSFLGQRVTAAKASADGVESQEGIVTSVSVIGGEYKLTVNGKEYTLKEVMLLHNTGSGGSGSTSTTNTSSTTKTDNNTTNAPDNTAKVDDAQRLLELSDKAESVGDGNGLVKALTLGRVYIMDEDGYCVEFKADQYDDYLTISHDLDIVLQEMAGGKEAVGDYRLVNSEAPAKPLTEIDDIIKAFNTGKLAIIDDNNVSAVVATVTKLDKLQSIIVDHAYANFDEIYAASQGTEKARL